MAVHSLLQHLHSMAGFQGPGGLDLHSKGNRASRGNTGGSTSAGSKRGCCSLHVSGRLGKVIRSCAAWTLEEQELLCFLSSPLYASCVTVAVPAPYFCSSCIISTQASSGTHARHELDADSKLSWNLCLQVSFQHPPAQGLCQSGAVVQSWQGLASPSDNVTPSLPNFNSLNRKVVP